MVLEHLGYIVLNPAWLPLGMEYEDYVAIDDAMLLQSDIICLLPGWAKSAGARREKKIAELNGIRVMFYKNIRCWERPFTTANHQARETRNETHDFRWD